jgi:ABC-type multidrug transport system permease subunit
MSESRLISNMSILSDRKRDSILQSFGSDYSERWRNSGLMCGYVMFNIIAALALYWYARVYRRRSG